MVREAILESRATSARYLGKVMGLLKNEKGMMPLDPAKFNRVAVFVTHARDSAGEQRVLGEEAVPRVHGLRAGSQRGLDQGVDLQIALRRRRRPDQERLVGVGGVQCASIGLRVDGDGADAELAQRAGDADGDLAAVRDQDLAEGAVHDGTVLSR